MSIKLAEAHIIAKIKALLGTTVRGVQSLPGDWDDDMLKRFLAAVPGVFLAWVGGPAQDLGGDGVQINARWMVYVATGHASGQEARRLGDAQQVGAYDLIEVLAPGLNGHDVPDVGTLGLVSVENLYTGMVDRQGLAVYALVYEMGMPFDPPSDDTLTPFVTFAAQLDVPPHDTAAEHRKWLDGDYSNTRPDAADTVTVPQP